MPTKLRVVDTNVIATANLWEDGKAQKCAQACSRSLLQIKRSGRLAVDQGGDILKEYRKHGSLAGEPGVGDEFVRWVHDQLGGQVELIPLTRSAHSYKEFPDDPELVPFDPSDRKFIAVANAHPEKPPVLQATDSKWWRFREAFQKHGIEIEFLCPAEIQAKHKQKVGGS